MNPLTVAPERLQRLRAACLDLPEAVEKVAWGDPTWRVRNKIFAMQKGNYEGGRPSLWLKAPDGAQSALVEGQPERFFVPPYVGHKGWVGVYLDTRSVDWPLLGSLIEESYGLIAPRQLAAAAGNATRDAALSARKTAAPKKKAAAARTSKKATARTRKKRASAPARPRRSS